MKKKINESQLRNIVRESIKRALLEYDYDEYQLDGPEGYGVDDDTYYDEDYSEFGLEPDEEEKRYQMDSDWYALDNEFNSDTINESIKKAVRSSIKKVISEKKKK